MKHPLIGWYTTPASDLGACSCIHRQVCSAGASNCIMSGLHHGQTFVFIQEWIIVWDCFRTKVWPCRPCFNYSYLQLFCHARVDPGVWQSRCRMLQNISKIILRFWPLSLETPQCPSRSKHGCLEQNTSLAIVWQTLVWKMFLYPLPTKYISGISPFLFPDHQHNSAEWRHQGWYGLLCRVWWINNKEHKSCVTSEFVLRSRTGHRPRLLRCKCCIT
jgi:hypothetical protein